MCDFKHTTRDGLQTSAGVRSGCAQWSDRNPSYFPFAFCSALTTVSHVFSISAGHNADGIRIQSYCAIIACLLINLWTDRKPTKRTFEMLCFHMMGWASDAELERHLAKLKQRDDDAAAKKQ